ncbi:hypothetical protein SUGI_0862730 [Cryptomeria japonica]|nr:hypothetical protein SUGI_0862730 [Cryptomeria japonica]
MDSLGDLRFELLESLETLQFQNLPFRLSNLPNAFERLRTMRVRALEVLGNNETQLIPEALPSMSSLDNLQNMDSLEDLQNLNLPFPLSILSRAQRILHNYGIQELIPHLGQQQGSTSNVVYAVPQPPSQFHNYETPELIPYLDQQQDSTSTVLYTSPEEARPPNQFGNYETQELIHAGRAPLALPVEVDLKASNRL